QDADDGQQADDTTSQATGEDDAQDQQPAAASTGKQSEQAPAPASSGEAGGTSGGTLTSPLVRKLLREAGLDTADVSATGPGGRITREDAERAIAAGGEGAGAPAQPAAAAGQAARPAGRAVTPPPPVQAVSGTPDRPEASPTQIDFGGERQVTQ